MSSLPQPQVLFGTAPVNPSVRACASNDCLILLGEAPGEVSRNRAAAPDTCGAEKLVPWVISCWPSSASAHVPIAGAWVEWVEATPKPGALISGLSTPSRRGPTHENDAMPPTVGGVTYPQDPLEHDGQFALVACAATANTLSPSAGEPTSVVLSSPRTTEASSCEAPKVEP